MTAGRESYKHKIAKTLTVIIVLIGILAIVNVIAIVDMRFGYLYSLTFMDKNQSFDELHTCYKSLSCGLLMTFVGTIDLVITVSVIGYCFLCAYIVSKCICNKQAYSQIP